jgi:hypothetical protein
MQKFLLGRPALLSGLITFSLGLVMAYSLFYLVPQTYSKFTKSNRSAAKARARAALLAMSKQPSMQRGHERSALAILANTPQSAFVQALYSLLLFAQACVIGSIGGSKASANDTAAIEQAAASIKLLELDNSSCKSRQPVLRFRKLICAFIAASSSLQRLSSFLHLYVLLHSSHWLSQEAASDVSAQANAVLSLASTNIFGKRGASFASSRWRIAQDQIKKHAETARPWLKNVLAVKYEEVLRAKSLFELADRQHTATLLASWRDLFAHVMLTTQIAGSAAEQTALATSVGTSTALNEMLAVQPASSQTRSLILLHKGVEAMEMNDKARVIQIAVELSKSSSKTAGVQAYLDIVTGAGFPDPPATFSSHSDCLAYVILAWLRLRAAISPSSSQNPTKVNDALQSSALKVRKLLAEDVFDGSESRFMEAQEWCLEGLVRIGRHAAGLYAESDSGCEM